MRCWLVNNHNSRHRCVRQSIEMIVMSVAYYLAFRLINIFKMQNTAIAKSAYYIHSPPSNFIFKMTLICLSTLSFFYPISALNRASSVWLIMKDAPIRHWICLVACLHNSIFHNILHCLMFGESGHRIYIVYNRKQKKTKM